MGATATSPGRITAKILKAVPIDVLSSHLNLWIEG